MEAADRLLSRIDELAPQLKPRAAEFEAARRIPRDVIETLRAVGVFRMVVPQSHGGLHRRFPGLDDRNRQRVRRLRNAPAAHHL